MSGHSHWAKVKRAKAVTDARRGQSWSKIARRIIVAAKNGGNPDDNLMLRYAIDEAKDANMPNDTITKAIKKGTGELGVTNYETVLYEGYGPGGVAFMVETLTDNRHRTAPELRKIFERGGGQLGSTNCVAWMFEQKGVFYVAADKADEDTLMQLALDSGADDIVRDGDSFQITCLPAAFTTIKQALAGAKIPAESAEITMLSKSNIQLTPDKARQAMNLMELFEEHEDVQHVYSNFDIPEEVMKEIGG